MLKENETIVSTADVPGDEGEELKRGEVGTIVHVHPDNEAVVVEFMSLDGTTVAIATVLSSEARPVRISDITHARTIAAAV